MKKGETWIMKNPSYHKVEIIKIGNVFDKVYYFYKDRRYFGAKNGEIISMSRKDFLKHFERFHE